MSEDTVLDCLACGSKNISNYIHTKTMMAPQDTDWQFQRCTDCKVVFLNPRVHTFNLTEYYTKSYLPYRGPEAWGKFADFVKWDLRKIDKSRLKIVKKYRPSHNIDTPPSILDVGCGKPSFLKMAIAHGYDGVGVDFSDEGWSSDPHAYQDIKLIVGEPSSIPNDISADIITMWHYLEHDYHPFVTLSNLLRNSHSDTKLIIEVPNHDSYSRKLYGAHWSGYHTPRHTGLYTISSMSALLHRAGWRVVDSYTHGTLDPYTLDWMSRMERAQIDWSASMESKFYAFVIGKLVRPRYFFDRLFSLGFMTLVAEPI